MLVLRVSLGNVRRGVCLAPRLHDKRTAPRLRGELPIAALGIPIFIRHQRLLLAFSCPECVEELVNTWLQFRSRCQNVLLTFCSKIHCVAVAILYRPALPWSIHRITPQHPCNTLPQEYMATSVVITHYKLFTQAICPGESAERIQAIMASQRRTWTRGMWDTMAHACAPLSLEHTRCERQHALRARERSGMA